MKIQVLKSGNSKANTNRACPFFVDVPPDGVDVRRPAQK
jgi:hypothetical protein